MLAVVIFHAFPAALKSGFIGVDIFFVISGFLISTIIFENLHASAFSFVEFYLRRIRRIFPALCVVLVSCYTFGWFTLFAPEFKQLSAHIVGGAGFISNIVLWREAGYFDTSADVKPLLHLWSLGIEEQFYIVWPLLLWLAWKRRIAFIAAALVVTSASFALNLHEVTVDLVAAFYSPLTRFWELLAGSILAWVLLNRNGIAVDANRAIGARLGEMTANIARKADIPAIANILSIAGVLMLAYGFWRIDQHTYFPGKAAAVPVAGTVLLLWAGPRAFINRYLLSNRVAVAIGAISYPLYLWHWPLLSFARIITAGQPTLNIRLACVAAAVALSVVTYLLVERPLRFGGSSRAKAGALAAALAIIGAVGLTTKVIGGIPSRLPEFVQTTSDFPCPEGRMNNDVCEVGNRSSQKTIVAYGDSHLNHLLLQIVSKLGPDYAIDIVYSAGCFMGDTLRIHGADTRAECDRKIAALERMRGRTPTAVITAQRWLGYGILTKADVIGAVNDRLGTFGMKPNTLIILGTTSNVPIDCEKSRQRPLQHLAPCVQDETTKAAVRTFTKTTSEMTVPSNVFFVHPYAHVCPNDTCIMSVNGISNFIDFNHLSLQGGESTAREINDIIRRR